MHYPMTIAGLERQLPLCKLNDQLHIAAFIMFGDTELTTACAQALLDIAPEYDYLLTAEAKSIPLIHEMARLHGDAKYFLGRKKKKIYMRDILEAKVTSITTQGEQTLYLDGNDADMMKGKRILIVDDVISTGQSLLALEKLAEMAGATICGKMAVLAEGHAAMRNDITVLAPLPLFDAQGKPLPIQ